MKPAGLVMIAAVGLAGLGHVLDRPGDQTASRTGPSAPPIVIGGERARQGGHPAERDEGFTATRSVGARRAAKRFLTAYLRWETGDNSGRVVAALRTSASKQLWQTLASSRGQPEVNSGVSRARLASLVAGTVGPDRAATVAAQLTRNGQPGGLAVVVKRRHGRWRVTSIGR